MNSTASYSDNYRIRQSLERFYPHIRHKLVILFRFQAADSCRCNQWKPTCRYFEAYKRHTRPYHTLAVVVATIPVEYIVPDSHD